MTFQTSRIFVIGGTGAQGIPVIKELVHDRKYSVLALTRDINSKRARDLAALGNVELLEGTFTDIPLVTNALQSCDGAFVNIDGFNTGEKGELYWGIRLYEIARAADIKFYVWGNLDYGLKKGAYDPKYRCGHYDGKGRVGEFVLQQSNDTMGAANFTTGPYLDMALASKTVMTPEIIDGVAVWRVPLGDGAVPHIALDDCGHYVRWLFDNTARSNGMDLEVATAHVPYADLAAAFAKVTGHPARYENLDFDSYFNDDAFRGPWSRMGSGYNSDPKDPAYMTNRQNFTGFWNLWRNSGGNEGVVQRDYKLLDEIHAKRIKTVEEWFRRQQEEKGDLWEWIQPKNMRPILKIAEDGRKGKL